ncbi:hypothetical protein LXJ58_32395, partial [Escherichia coli]|nr:hypothetical protein [Escherichia coli]
AMPSPPLPAELLGTTSRGSHVGTSAKCPEAEPGIAFWLVLVLSTPSAMGRLSAIIVTPPQLQPPASRSSAERVVRPTSIVQSDEQKEEPAIHLQPSGRRDSYLAVVFFGQIHVASDCENCTDDQDFGGS